MWTAHTDEAMGSPGSPKVLKPDPADDAPHGEPQQVNHAVISPTLANVIVQLFGESDKRHCAETMGKVGDQQRALVDTQTANQTIKEARGIPESVNKNDGAPRR